MMYWYWKKKGFRPSTFYSMPKGELLIIRAFYEMEIDEEIRKVEAINKGGFACPHMM